MVEHYLGKVEVTGSSPVISSKQKQAVYACFFNCNSVYTPTFAKKLINKIDPLTVAGDANLVLSRYGHYLKDEAKKASNQMNDVFFKKVLKENA